MSEQPELDYWRRCNSCKKPIAYKAVYWVCNVSTCNRKRTGMVFCTTACWDAHLPIMNHREAWAEERRAPNRDEWQRQLQEEAEGKPRTRKPRGPSVEPTVENQTPPAAPPRVILRRKQES